MQKLEKIDKFDVKRTIALYSILIISMGVLGIGTYSVFAQTEEEPSLGAGVAAIAVAVPSIVIAVIALARDIIKIKAVNERISTETKETLLSHFDGVESLMTKVSENSTEMKQLTDIIYNQLLPEESKKIIEGSGVAVKANTLAQKLMKDTESVQQIRDVISQLKLDRISQEAAKAKIQNILANVTDTPTAKEIKKSAVR